MRLVQPRRHLHQRDIPACFNQPEDEGRVDIQTGAARFALTARRPLARLARSPQPPDRGSDPDIEPRRSRPGRKAGRSRRQNTHPQIVTICPRHRPLPQQKG